VYFYLPAKQILARIFTVACSFNVNKLRATRELIESDMISSTFG